MSDDVQRIGGGFCGGVNNDGDDGVGECGGRVGGA